MYELIIIPFIINQVMNNLKQSFFKNNDSLFLITFKTRELVNS